MKKVIKYLDKFLNILILCIMFAVILTCVRVYMGYETFIRIGNFQMYQVLSGSMSPVFEMEDFIVVKEISVNRVRVGDIITYMDDESLVTHRVTRILPEDSGALTVITKGDSNSVEDDPIMLTEESLKGKLCFKIPVLGKVSKLSKTFYGFILMACLPVAIIMITFIIAIFRRMDKHKPLECTDKGKKIL